jgi:hypothetical protein
MVLELYNYQIYPEIAVKLNIYSIHECRETKEKGKWGPVSGSQNSQ